MKNESAWKPSKYRLLEGRLRASTDSREVGPGSRLVVECIASFYERAIPAHARGRLIDLGCGKAPLYIKYKECVDSVTCVDWGNTPHKNSNLDLECDLTQPLVFEDASFDTVILSDVLEHLPEPELLWSEINRILRPGGCLLMNVPYFYPLHEVPYDFYRYSCYALERFANRHGFDVLELDPIGGSPEIVIDIIAKHLQFAPLVGPGLAVLLQRTGRALLGTNWGRRVSRKSSERFPLGYSMVARKR
jgi:SAM-dependent methyltransferase